LDAEKGAQDIGRTTWPGARRHSAAWRLRHSKTEGVMEAAKGLPETIQLVIHG
jgi:hypothetical protein